MSKRSQNINDVRYYEEVSCVRPAAVAWQRNEANFHVSFTFVAVLRQAGGLVRVDTESGESAPWQSELSVTGGSRQTRHDPQARSPRRLTGGPRRGEKCPNEAKISTM